MDRERQTMQQGRGKDQDERKSREEESGLEFGRRRESVIDQNPLESVEARRIRARVNAEGCSEAVDQAKIIARTTRPSGGKDRHSKVNTAKGPRDRRVRLSVATAIQFYDVQDRLGYDQPSKAVEWLIKKAKHAIDELPPAPPIQYAVAKPAATGAAFCGSAPAAGGAGASSGYGYSEVLFGGSVSGSGFGNMFKEEDAEAEEQELGQAVGSWRQEERSISEGSKGSEGLGSPSARIESRAKARERARERTREKSCGRSPPRSGSGNLVENTFSFTNLLQSPLNQNAMYTPAPAPAQAQAQQSLHSQQNYSFHQQNHQNQNRQIHLQSLFQHSGPLPIQHNALERKPNYPPPPSFLHPEAQPRSPLLSRPPPPSSMGSFLSSEFNPFAGISADHFSSFRPPSSMPVDDHSSHSVRSFPFLNNPSFYLSPASAPSSSPSENLGHILRPSPASLFDYQRDLRHFSSYQPHVPARIHGIDEMDENLKHHSSPSP